MVFSRLSMIGLVMEVISGEEAMNGSTRIFELLFKVLLSISLPLFNS